MNLEVIVLSVTGLIVVLGSIIVYFSTIPNGKVPEKISGLVLRLCFGIGLSVLAVVWSYQTTGFFKLAVVAPAVFATLFGSLILWLLSLRKTPIGNLKVKVGDKLLPFEATTSGDVAFHSDALVGKRTLLKFFRGGW